MYQINILNKISPVGLERFESDRYTVGSEVAGEDGIVVRSAPLLDYEFPESLLAIARAGAGVNNIPVDQCTERALWFSTLPAPMPTRSRSWFWRGC